MIASVIPASADSDILCYKTLNRNYIYIHVEIINNEILIYYTDVSAI
jgi:hypothetical protein